MGLAIDTFPGTNIIEEKDYIYNNVNIGHLIKEQGTTNGKYLVTLRLNRSSEHCNFDLCLSEFLEYDNLNNQLKIVFPQDITDRWVLTDQWTNDHVYNNTLLLANAKMSKIFLCGSNLSQVSLYDERIKDFNYRYFDCEILDNNNYGSGCRVICYYTLSAISNLIESITGDTVNELTQSVINSLINFQGSIISNSVVVFPNITGWQEFEIGS